MMPLHVADTRRRGTLALAWSLAVGCVPVPTPAPARTAVGARPSALRAIDLAWGGSFCALRSDGRVVCWGRNEKGSLGTESLEASSVPTIVPGLDRVVEIEGYRYQGFCALRADRSLWCWGFAQLGRDGRLAPTQVLADVVDFTFAKGQKVGNPYPWESDEVCARHSNGSISCAQFVDDPPLRRCTYWTDQARTKCLRERIATKVQASPPPAQETLQFGGRGGRAAVDIRGPACVLRGRQVHCHGSNDLGQLGDPTRSGSSFAPVPGLDDVVSLDSWQLGSCAVHATGQIVCWGVNDGRMPPARDPELCPDSGRPSRGCNRRPTPLAISDGAQISLRGGLTILTRSGRVFVRCSTEHQDAHACVLGDYEEVGGLPPLRRVEVGHYATCGLAADGQVVCFGRYSELGDGATLVDREARAVPGVSGATMVRVQHEGGACAVLGDGTVRCWGQSDPPRGLRDITMLGDGCALARDGRVWCWGTNGDGEMGLGTQLRPGAYKRPNVFDHDVLSTPLPVPHLRDTIDLASDGFRSCAVDKLGALRCWGLFVPSKFHTWSPRLISGLPPVSRAFPADLRMFALGRDGSIWSISDDHRNPTPEVRPALDMVGFDLPTHGGRALNEDEHGQRVLCAITPASEVRCVGMATPPGLGKVRQISVSSVQGAGPALRGCVVRDDGHLLCWGPPYCAEGAADCGGELLSRVDDLFDRVVQVSVGSEYACAVRTDGSVWCWGMPDPGPIGGSPVTDRRVSTVRIGDR